jgi:hypothetical protein
MGLHISPSPYRRWLAAACLVATAAVHLAIAPEHLREAPYAGVLFIALGAAALATALLLIAVDHELVWLSAGALCVSALASYAISRSIGLPSMADDVGDWLNPLGVVAVLSEATAALIAWQALLSAPRVRPRST